MRILITTECWTPTINGVVTSVVSLKESLENLGVEVRVLTVSPTFESYYSDGVYYLASIPVDSIYTGARITLRHKRKLLKDIIEWNPDLIHSNSEFSTFIVAKKIADSIGIPIVHTYHTDYERYSQYLLKTKETSRTSRRMVKSFCKTVLNNCAVVIAPSEKTASQLRGYRIRPEIEVVPTGVNEEFYRAHIDRPLELLREDLNVPSDRPILLSVSRLGEEKSVDRTLTNFSELLKNSGVSSIHPFLVIVGGGPDEARLKKLSETLRIDKDVLWVGMVPPQMVKLYYSMADIFVSSSTSETQGLTYMEAQSSGLPLLCRKDEALTNILIEGLTGESFDDEKGFTEGYLRIMRHSDEMRTAALLNAKKWTKKRFGERILEIYSRTIDSNSI